MGRTLKERGSGMIDPKLKAKNATVDSCFDLVGSRQHGVIANVIEQPVRTRVVSSEVISTCNITGVGADCR